MGNSGAFFLWDEPPTQGKSVQWAAQQWIAYSNRWASSLQKKRSEGMVVTTPLFNKVADMATFFGSDIDGRFSNPSSTSYIDAIVWNAWITNTGNMKAEAQWILDQSGGMKAKYNNRPIWLGNFAYLGKDASPGSEVNVIWNSGIFDENNGIDSVYYFAGTDYGHVIPNGVNFLAACCADNGNTIGHELMRKCTGASLLESTPTVSSGAAMHGGYPFNHLDVSLGGLINASDESQYEEPIEDAELSQQEPEEPNLEGGCAPVTKLVFDNQCSKDIELGGWNQVVGAGQTWQTTSGRPSSDRIQWKYTDGDQFDFIELNAQWSGPGSGTCAHPSYSNYNGFSMASKYEALNPSDGQFACSTPGAAITCHPSEGSCAPGNGYLCKGSTDCASSYSKWMRQSCSFVINPDGTFTHSFRDTTHGVNYGDFWCDEKHGFNELVGTMFDCVDHAIPIMFVITTCVVHPNFEGGNATLKPSSINV